MGGGDNGIRKLRGRVNLRIPPAGGSIAGGVAPVDEFLLSAFIQCFEPRGLICEQGRLVVWALKGVANAVGGYIASNAPVRPAALRRGIAAGIQIFHKLIAPKSPDVIVHDVDDACRIGTPFWLRL
jgi:hypothetical protein